MLKSNVDRARGSREILIHDDVQFSVAVGPTRADDAASIVFLHGWCCNATMLAPQLNHFCRDYRVIAPDLCGHGESSAPQREYTVEAFADDLAWVIRHYELERPVIVGHSMGGNIALHLAARYPELTSGVAMIDSAIFLPPDLRTYFTDVTTRMRSPDYRQVIEAAASGLFLPTDDPVRKVQIIAAMVETPQHVAISAAVEHLLRYDSSWALSHCRCPLVYIAAAQPLTDVPAVCARWPALTTAQTLGVGHFSQLEAPEQINAMLARFIGNVFRWHLPRADITPI